MGRYEKKFAIFLSTQGTGTILEFPSQADRDQTKELFAELNSGLILKQKPVVVEERGDTFSVMFKTNKGERNLKFNNFDTAKMIWRVLTEIYSQRD